jgi:hypothetical protein
MKTLRAVFIKTAKTFTRNGSGLFVKAAQGCLWKRSRLFLNAQGCFFKAVQGCFFKAAQGCFKTLRAVFKRSGLFPVNSGVD